ncbi:unannotated protein [freshwater metagenome]|uniref:Unannotated protein n=1 Tax=freshwater metagenome TaxID=449393 RepID=A0A6J6XY44_9ZZZZ
MFNTVLVEFARQQFALLNADSTNQDWLAFFVFLFDISNNCFKLCSFGLKNQVCLVNTHHLSIGWDRNNLQPIGIHQLGCFGLRSTGHAGEFVVHAEIILQGDSCERLVFFFDLDALFGLNRLVNTLTPTTAFKNSTCKFVDNFYFTILDDVVLIALIQHGCFEGHLQLMHQVLLHFVIQVGDAKLLFYLFDSGLGWHHDALVFFNFIIDVSLERPDDRSKLVIRLGRIGNASRNNQWSTSLVNQD